MFYFKKFFHVVFTLISFHIRIIWCKGKTILFRLFDVVSSQVTHFFKSQDEETFVWMRSWNLNSLRGNSNNKQHRWNPYIDEDYLHMIKRLKDSIIEWKVEMLNFDVFMLEALLLHVVTTWERLSLMTHKITWKRFSFSLFHSSFSSRDLRSQHTPDISAMNGYKRCENTKEERKFPN